MIVGERIAPVARALSTPAIADAISTVSIATAVFSFAIERLIGTAGFIAILVALVALCGLSLATRMPEWTGHRLLPVSLLVLVGWAGSSLIWSSYRWATVTGFASLGGFAILAVYIAITRDTLQIVRCFGAVLRAALAASLALELLAGVFFDSPMALLDIDGRLAELGPIQGIEGSRNRLGLIAVLAVITFAIEFATRSVELSTSIVSLSAAGIVLLLTRSPLAIGVALCVAAAFGVLTVIRRQPVERRALWQWVGLALTAVALVVVWAVRTPLIALLSANSELAYRLTLWRRVWALIGVNPLQGWGWLGAWRSDVPPYSLLAVGAGRAPGSAASAYLDAWLQLGVIGMILFAGFILLALVRSWLIAGRRSSVVYVWPALMLIALIVIGSADSAPLLDFGWLIVVICSIKAAAELSWRTALGAITARIGAA